MEKYPQGDTHCFSWIVAADPETLSAKQREEEPVQKTWSDQRRKKATGAEHPCRMTADKQDTNPGVLHNRFGSPADFFTAALSRRGCLLCLSGSLFFCPLYTVFPFSSLFCSSFFL